MNTITNVKNTWTYKNPKTIIILALLIVVGIQHINTSGAQNNIMEYTSTIEYTQDTKDIQLSAKEKLNKALEVRAYEIFEEKKFIFLEQSRLEAIEEQNRHLLLMVNESPFIELDHKNKRVINLK